MNKLLSLFSLGSWQLLAAVVVLTASVAGFAGWQARTVVADRDIAQARLELLEYKNHVLQDTVAANVKTAEMYRQVAEKVMSIEDKYAGLQAKQIEDSQTLLKGLKNVSSKSCPVSDGVERYITELRNLQQLHSP